MDAEKYVQPNRESFGQDPFGYSASAWHKWGLAQTISGFEVDITRPPTSDELKSPVLWLTQAHALSEAATTLLRNSPDLQRVPDLLKGVCDCQYCAVVLMLVGYSLEICLKAMLIMQKGVATYTNDEAKHRHHKLEKLSEFVPNLSAKDKAILRTLTQFVMWAGRYPDPGSGREGDAEDIFAVSEKYRVSACELFDLASRVMRYSRQIAAAL
ncbi:MAG: hypothetical protein JWR07_1822 [Nevskia sp.]|nr:hypothetical protein [Nevskia sp.]